MTVFLVLDWAYLIRLRGVDSTSSWEELHVSLEEGGTETDRWQGSHL